MSEESTTTLAEGQIEASLVAPNAPTDEAAKPAEQKKTPAEKWEASKSNVFVVDVDKNNKPIFVGRSDRAIAYYDRFNANGESNWQFRVAYPNPAKKGAFTPGPEIALTTTEEGDKKVHGLDLSSISWEGFVEPEPVAVAAPATTPRKSREITPRPVKGDKPATPKEARGAAEGLKEMYPFVRSLEDYGFMLRNPKTHGLIADVKITDSTKARYKEATGKDWPDELLAKYPSGEVDTKWSMFVWNSLTDEEGTPTIHVEKYKRPTGGVDVAPAGEAQGTAPAA